MTERIIMAALLLTLALLLLTVTAISCYDRWLPRPELRCWVIAFDKTEIVWEKYVPCDKVK